MSDVPSNLIPTRITQLPNAPTASEDGLLLFIYQGNSYKIRAGDLLSVAGVPTSRQVIAGTGMSGGGQLGANVTLSIAPGGVGTAELASTGVTPATYGSATTVPVFTVDATGRVVSAASVPVQVSGYVPESREVIAGDGLVGGGSLNANVTLSAEYYDLTPLTGNQSGSAGVLLSLARGDHEHPAVDLSNDNEVDNVLGLNNGGTARSIVADAGAIVWSGADGLYVGPPGLAGQVLVSGGTGEYTWGSALVVTDQNANLFYAGPTSGSPAPTSFRNIVNDDLPDTGAAAATYGSTTRIPVFTVNSKGLITSISDVVLSAGTVTSVNVSGNTTGLTFTGGPVTSSGTITMGGTLAVTNGGTGAISSSGARTNLGLGTMATQNANSVAVTGGTIDGTAIGNTARSSIKATTIDATDAVTLPASTSGLVPLHISPGTQPSSVSNGDIWVETTGLFAKNNAFTHQLDFDTNTSGTLSKVAITITGSGATFSAASIEAFLFSLPNWTGDFKKFVIPAATGLALVDNAANYLTVNYNSGSPAFAVTTDVTSINGSNIAGAAILYRMGTEVHFQPVDWGLAPASRTNRRFIQTDRYQRASGLALGESAGLVITLSAGVIWYGVSEYAELAVTSAASNADFYFHVAGVYTKSVVSTYNNLQYDNGTNLATLGGGKYAVNWVYRYLDGAGLPKLAYVLGGGDYSRAQATASAVPTPPAILSSMAILVGRIIVVKSGTTATQIDSAFTQTFSSTSIIDHNDLANLQGGVANEYFHLTSAEYTGTGTGVFVRATSPTLVTPALGTPSALVGTNITGTASALSIGGNAATATTATTATSATTATNLAGGAASRIPYQTGAGATAFIANGTAGQVLTSAGASVPVWSGISGGTF